MEFCYKHIHLQLMYIQYNTFYCIQLAQYVQEFYVANYNNEPTLKSKIIDFSDCTTTDFRAAMAMEFYSIKCQFLIRT